MGKVLNLTPPQLTGDVKKDMAAVERYLYQLTEQVDYHLLQLEKKQAKASDAEEE